MELSEMGNGRMIKECKMNRINLRKEENTVWVIAPTKQQKEGQVMLEINNLGNIVRFMQV